MNFCLFLTESFLKDIKEDADIRIKVFIFASWIATIFIVSIPTCLTVPEQCVTAVFLSIFLGGFVPISIILLYYSSLLFYDLIIRKKKEFDEIEEEKKISLQKEEPWTTGFVEESKL